MWKQRLLEFSKNFKHPAWGFSHFKRVYDLTLDLAEAQQLDIDNDALFAAAYLHDIGAFQPYQQKGKDHTDSTIENCDEIFNTIGFPSKKKPLAKEIIKSHMFYAKTSESIESKIFHDADTLDFLGIIGITRILSIIGKSDWTPDLKSAIILIEKFSKDLPKSLLTEKAKEIGRLRQKEMIGYLKNLRNETNNLDTI